MWIMLTKRQMKENVKARCLGILNTKEREILPKVQVENRSETRDGLGHRLEIRLTS